MNISFLNNQTIQKIANFNLNTPKISFKGGKEDSFEKTTKTETNPNTDFLREPNLTHKQKMDILKDSGIIFTSNHLSKKIGEPKANWFNKNAFIVENYTPEASGYSKTPRNTSIFDLSIPINKENFETLMSVKGHAIGPEFLHSPERYHRYVGMGLIKPVMLKSTNGNDLVPTKLIDLSDPINAEGVEKAQSLMPAKSAINKQLINAHSGQPVIVDIFTLSKHGISTPKELAKLVKAGKLKGELIKNEEGKIKNAQIDVNHYETRRILQKLRTQRYIGIETLSKKSGVPIEKIEKEILAKNIKADNQILFLTEPEELFIDTKDQKSIETFDRLLFEQKVEIELQKQISANQAKIKKEDKSTRMKIAWHLCPNTRKTFGILAQENPQLKELMKKKEVLKEIFDNAEDESDVKEATRSELIKLNKQEEIELKKFFKTMWNRAGSEEFKIAIKQADEILEEYHAKDITAVKDQEIRKIILNID